jgi:Xaa-Pro aminopeptidase
MKLASERGFVTSFAPAEYENRVRRLKERMRALGVEVALFDEIEAMAWLSGYGNSQNRWRCIVIPLEGEPFFLIRTLDAQACSERTWISDVISFADWEDPVLTLAMLLKNRRLDGAKIGLDWNSYSTSIARFEQIKEALPHAHLINIGALIWELRLIKSPAEIALLSSAARICDEALLRAAHLARPGATQRDLLLAAAIAFIEGGAEPAHPGVVTFAQGDNFLHRHMSEARLRDSDVIHLEVVPKFWGYSAREMRSIPVGPPSADLVHIADDIAAIQDEQFSAMKPGALACDVDAIMRGGLIAAGLRDSYENITGYTLGFYVTQGPRTSDFTRIFHPKSKWKLEEGQVFHMYAAARGVSLSETVVIEATGSRRLTSLPRQLLRVS